MAERRIRVVAALFRDGERFLLTQRPPGGSFPNFWEFPGGKVEAGEDDRTALARELLEELGARCSVGDLFHESAHAYPAFTLDFSVYCCLVVEGPLQRLQVQDLRWVSPEEAAHLQLPPADAPVLRALGVPLLADMAAPAR